MAEKIQTLLVSLEARINQYEATMRKAMAATNKSAKSIEDRFARMNRNLGSGFGGLGGLIGKAFAGAAALRGAQVLIDASTRIENSLKVAGVAGEELSRVYDRLFASAQKNAAPLESLVELYGRAALVQKDLGVTTEELLGFTDNIAVALRVSGKSASESSGALLQLSQALGSGTVRAEEFNSILEGALPIAQAAAAGLKEAGGSVAKLRQLVVDGKISSEAFFRAFEAGSATLTDKVAGSTFTVAQQFEQLRTVLIDAAGKFDDATGASKATASGLNQLAAAIQNLGDYFERNTGRIKPFFDALAAADDFDPAEFRKKLGLGAIDDFLEGTSLIEWRFGFASQQVAARAEEMGAALGDVEYAIREVALASQGVVSEEASEKILALAGDLFAGKVSADDAKKALLDLGTADPDTSGITSRLVALVATLDAVRKGAISAFNATASVAGTPASFAGQDTYKPPVKTVSLADLKKPGTGSGKGKSPGEKFADSLEDQRERTRFLEEEIALQRALNPLVSDYGFALERLKTQQDLQSAAAAAGLKLTPELKATIDELATGYANATVEAAKLTEAQEAGRDSMLEWFDLGKTATRGFIDDLLAGKSAAEALGNVFQQLGNKLLDLGLNSLFGTGQGSSPFGLLGKAFGFASGGYTGAGGKYEPAGVVHRGEYVFDKAATSRLGVSNLERLRKGYAQGGFVGMPGSMPTAATPSISAPISIQIDATGADAAGLARVEQRLAQLRAELPGLTVKAVRDAGKRGVKM